MSNEPVVVTINGVHFHDEGFFHGYTEDGTMYVLNLAADEMASLARGETVDERRCPRCDFEDAMNILVYAGDYIREHYRPGEPGWLNDAECAIVDAGRAWLADDAITRCLDEDAHDSAD